MDIHPIIWAEDGLVAVSCGKKGVNDPHLILHADDPPLRCRYCGVLLRLVWNVQVQRVDG